MNAFAFTPPPGDDETFEPDEGVTLPTDLPSHGWIPGLEARNARIERDYARKVRASRAAAGGTHDR